jgi:PTH1 family peptidyl-tRNA hydrolase
LDITDAVADADAADADAADETLADGDCDDEPLAHRLCVSEAVDEPHAVALCDAVARNAELLAKGDDAGFQNKAHLAMAAAGFNSA